MQIEVEPDAIPEHDVFFTRHDHERSPDGDCAFVWAARVLFVLCFLVSTTSTVQVLFRLPLWVFPIIAMGVLAFAGTVLSYHSARTIDPSDPPDPAPVDEDAEHAAARQRAAEAVARGSKLVDLLYPVRFCSRCDAFRRPRSYHCKKCGRCVDRRDHHCPWIGQCVGKNNFKFFLLFLFYTSIALLICQVVNVTDVVLVFIGIVCFLFMFSSFL